MTAAQPEPTVVQIIDFIDGVVMLLATAVGQLLSGVNPACRLKDANQGLLPRRRRVTGHNADRPVTRRARLAGSGTDVRTNVGGVSVFTSRFTERFASVPPITRDESPKASSAKEFEPIKVPDIIALFDTSKVLNVTSLKAFSGGEGNPKAAG